jgi:hypothetical protein
MIVRMPETYQARTQGLNTVMSKNTLTIAYIY